MKTYETGLKNTPTIRPSYREVCLTSCKVVTNGEAHKRLLENEILYVNAMLTQKA
jgi:hypothetical protein